MNHKSRMQTRRRRFDGWDPIQHNRYVAFHKEHRRLNRRFREVALAFRALGRAAREVAPKIQELGTALREIERG